MGLFRSFYRELLLQSGQFALFYLLVQFSISGAGLFADVGHTALLVILALQTAVLAQWGEKPWVRFTGSLIAPMFYTFLESLDGSEFLTNSAHAGFWIFSALVGALQAGILRSRRVSVKAVLEFTMTFVNVLIFFLLYFYFDTQNSGVARSELTLGKIFNHLPDFLVDPTHVYVVVGGLVLAFSLALGRTDVLRLKERLNTLFGQYVDRDIRDEILAGGGTRSRQVRLAVLFSDLRNFTGSSEKADPQAVTEMLNLYFSAWTTVVEKHGGVVDKFIGDAVMVLFGLKEESGACNAAVDCGREMLARWPQLEAQFRAKGLPVPDGLGIGVHFGSVILGDIGSETRRNYTVVGDTVNTASRLESSCKQAGHPFLVSEEVRAQLSPERAEFCSRLGALHLKGKEASMEVWVVAP